MTYSYISSVFRSSQWMIFFAPMCLISLYSQAASTVDIFEFSEASDKSRYQSLIQEFRCPKCLNINIAGSDAPIAQDLRRTVYRLIVDEKMTDDEIRNFLQERYGDFVLYDPPLNERTWLIWSMPLLFLVLGIWWVFSTKIRSASESRIELSQSDRDQLKKILDDNR